MLHPGTAVPASEQINKRIATNFQYIQEVHAHLKEIIEVASHLTPVEDLVMFQGMVEDLHEHLGLLVDAAEIIVQITPFGFDWIRVDTPAEGRAMLELGTAALKDEEYFAKATEFALLYAQVQSIAEEVTGIVAYLPTLATKAELAGVETELTALIDALRLDLDALEAEVELIGNTVITIGGDISGLASAVSTLQTEMTEVQDGVVINATAITALQAGLEDAESGIEANSTAISTLTTEVSTIDGNVTSLASDVTALSASIVGIEEDVTAQGSAISTLSTEVASHGTSIEVLSTSITSLDARVDGVEDGLVANASALEELTVQVEDNADGLVLEAEQRTQLEASLTGGGNLLPNTNFESGTSGWTINQRGAGWSDVTLVTDPIAGIIPTNRHTLGIAIDDGNAPVGTVSIVAPSVPVEPGKQYFLSGYFATDKMSLILEARWLNAAGVLVSSEQVGAMITDKMPASDALAAWDPRNSAKVLAPSDARTLQYRILGSDVTAANPRLAILSPMVEEASEKQTVPSPWSESGIGLGTALANVEQTLTAMIEASGSDITALAAAVTALDVRVDDVESDLSGQATAINSLETRVTAAEGGITANSSAITSINVALAGKASASSVTALASTVSTQGGQISANTSAISSLNATVGSNSASIVTLGQVTAGANFTDVRNGSFETSDSWGSNTIGTGALPTDVYYTNTVGHMRTGAYAMRSDGQASTRYIYNAGRTSCKTGEQFRVGVYVRRSPTAPSGGNVSVGIRCYDAAGAYLSGSAVSVSKNVTSLTTSYELLSTIFTIPEGAVTFGVWVSFGHTVGGVIVDDVFADRLGEDVVSLRASYTLVLDVNGYVSGYRTENTGTSSSFDINADYFRILKPGGGARTEFSNGNWRVYDSAGTLRVRMGIW